MWELLTYGVFQLGFLFAKLVGIVNMDWWMVFIPFYIILLWLAVSITIFMCSKKPIT